MMQRIEHGIVAGAAIAWLAAWLAAPSARAQPQLSAELAPLQFMVGHWASDDGHAEGGRTARGNSSIEPAAGGRALLRRDTTEILDPAGKFVQSFEQIMMIYPENGHVHGDYFDGTHVIHYVDAVVAPPGTVSFVSAAAPDAPAFRLTYTQTGATHIGIRFEMRPPGTSAFHLIAQGTAHRVS
jgi:hypothetical protein